MPSLFVSSNNNVLMSFCPRYVYMPKINTICFAFGTRYARERKCYISEWRVSKILLSLHNSRNLLIYHIIKS